MKSSVILAIALRYLIGKGARHFARTWGAIIGIGISLIPLIVVLHSADGMIRGIVSRFIETGTYHLQAQSAKPLDKTEIATLREKLMTVPHVTAVIPEWRGAALSSNRSGDRSGITIRAVAPDVWETDPELRRYLEIEDGLFDLSQNDYAVVGKHVARSLDLQTGDTLRVITTRTIANGRSIPRISSFTITGIFSSGYQDLDRLWVYIPLESGLRVIQSEEARLIMGIKVADPYSIPNNLFPSSDNSQFAEMISHLAALLQEDFRIYSWYNLQAVRYQSFRSTKNILLFIMGLIICIASFNISSTLITLTHEKRFEIALLKSIGTPPQAIGMIFIMCGFIGGVGGVIIGMPIGLLLSLQINWVLRAVETVIAAAQRGASWAASGLVGNAPAAEQFDQAEFYLEAIPVYPQLSGLLLIAASTIMLATLSALTPALRASKLRPISVIQRV